MCGRGTSFSHRNYSLFLAPPPVWAGFAPCGPCVQVVSTPILHQNAKSGPSASIPAFSPSAIMAMSFPSIPTCSLREAVVSEWWGPHRRAARPGPQVCCSWAGPASHLACRGAGLPTLPCVLLPWGACLLVRVSDSFPESAGSPRGDAEVTARKQALSPGSRRLPHSRRCHPGSARPVRPLTSARTRRKQQFTHHCFNNTCSPP